MINLRYGLQKHFSRVREKKIDTVNDTQFKEANEMFHAMLVKLKVKQAGKGSVTHKVKVDPISKEDFLKIKSSSVLDGHRHTCPGRGGGGGGYFIKCFCQCFSLTNLLSKISQSDARISVAYKICQ